MRPGKTATSCDRSSRPRARTSRWARCATRFVRYGAYGERPQSSSSPRGRTRVLDRVRRVPSSSDPQRSRSVPRRTGGTPADAGRRTSELDSLAVARKIRVVIAKPGLDGHDRGAKIIARALRDAGMEVIYTGLHQTPEQIVETAIQEDADAVGISILSGAHMTLVPRILDGLKENGAEDVLVVLGGTIPTADADELKEQGVAEVFTPGAPTSQIVDFLRAKVAA